MGKRKNQNIYPSSTRPIALTALFFSILACGMSGFVLFQTYNDGQLIDNVKIIGDEASKIFDGARQTFRDKQSSEDNMRWDKVRDRISRIVDMTRDGDSRASYYIDVLRDDLQELKDYSSEKGGERLDKVIGGLAKARERLADDTSAAAERLEKINDDLAPRVRALVDRGGEGDEEDEDDPDAKPTDKDAESVKERVED